MPSFQCGRLALMATACAITCCHPKPVTRLHFRHRFAEPGSVESNKGKLPFDAEGHRSFSEKALIIRDPALLDSVPDWQFPALIRRAAAVGRVNDPEQVFCGSADFRKLLDSFGPGDGPLDDRHIAWIKSLGDASVDCLSTAPFWVAAIVNRADFGRPVEEGGKTKITGAELRFVLGAYNAKRSPMQISDILEFVLPPMDAHDFQQYVQEWDGIAKEKDAHKYATKLDQLVAATLPKSESVRMRLGYQTPGASIWKFAQFAITDGTFRLVALDREISPPALYTNRFTETGPDLKSFIQSNTSQIMDANYQIDGKLATNSSSIQSEASALTLDHTVLTDAEQLRNVRFILSINTCSGCHQPETNNVANGRARFTHIANRTAAAKSTLSSFLTGGGDDATLDEYKVTPKLSRSVSNPVAPATRSFNDLVRRHSYMCAVQAMGRGATTEDWTRALEPFRVEETH